MAIAFSGRSDHRRHRHQIPLKTTGSAMLWTIALILIILWLLGFSIHIGGALIHLLLVAAVIVILVRIIQGNRVL
jgi:hypothetical protein